MFSVQLQRQTPHALFQNPNIMRCKSMRILAPETGDKAGTWIKGLEKLSKNFIPPDRARFHSNISMCAWQYLGEIFICVYIYHTFQFVYQRCKFHPRPRISGDFFQTTANFPTKVLAFPGRGRRGFALLQKIKHHVNISDNLYHVKQLFHQPLFTNVQFTYTQ